MAVLKCKMCGGSLTFEESASVCECEYCGSKQTLPKQDDEKKLKLFDRANRLRFNCEFDKAASVYESIIAEFPEEAEAYWGNLLCKYGIEYVDDPAGDKVPTCHRSSFDCVLDDPDFEMVMENADVISRAVYREQAKQIEQIRKGIIEVSGKEQPYDIFICYKETDENGGRTLDSVLAQDVYEALTAKGYRVFFSRITLEDKLGTEYEPYIFAALNSAKVMLAFGTSYDYYNAVWVKNEWSRYIKLMAADKSKHLIPCYKDIDAYDMPKEFARLQAQDMGKVGAVQDLLRGIDKLTGRSEKDQTAPNPQQTVSAQTAGNAEKLMQRVYLFLEDKNWEQATAYIEKILDEEPKFAPAYVGKVLAKHKLTSETLLRELRESIDGEPDWQKALRFATDPQIASYISIANDINKNEALDKTERKYNTAKQKEKEKEFPGAILLFHEIDGYQDSGEHLRSCIQTYRKQLVAEDETQLAELKMQVKEAEKKHSESRKNVKDSEDGKSEALKRQREISEDIRKAENELEQVHGLFSGGKKRDLMQKLDNLKKERISVESCFDRLDNDITSSKTAQKNAEAFLNKMKEKLNKAGISQKLSAEERWPDEAVIKNAKDVVRAREAAWGVGKSVTFGSFKQKENGEELPVEWLVLARNGNNALLLSKYGLDTMPYHTEYTDITWEKCTLRSWLNGEFYNTAFTAAEQARIQLTAVDNSKAQGFSECDYDGGNNTQDKVFLLSCEEANKYLGVRFCDESEARENIKARVSPTPYAKANGAMTSDECGEDKDKKTAEGAAAGWWWLRSCGYSQFYASYVYFDGAFAPDAEVAWDSLVVRPALWMKVPESSVPMSV